MGAGLPESGAVSSIAETFLWNSMVVPERFDFIPEGLSAFRQAAAGSNCLQTAATCCWAHNRDKVVRNAVQHASKDSSNSGLLCQCAMQVGLQPTAVHAVNHA